MAEEIDRYERPVNPDNPNGYANNVNGRWVSDEEYQAWQEMLEAVMEGEMAEAQAIAEQYELIRPLNPTEVLAAMIHANPDVVESMPDETVGRMQPYFPRWATDTEYAVGDIVTYGEGDGVVYRCLQAHTSQDTWVPTDAPSLWAKVLTDAGEILPWEQPSSTNPYMKGDKVLWDGKVWVSDVDNNVWMPGVYGWSEVV